MRGQRNRKQTTPTVPYSCKSFMATHARKAGGHGHGPNEREHRSPLRRLRGEPASGETHGEDDGLSMAGAPYAMNATARLMAVASARVTCRAGRRGRAEPSCRGGLTDAMRQWARRARPHPHVGGGRGRCRCDGGRSVRRTRGPGRPGGVGWAGGWLPPRKRRRRVGLPF